MNLNSLRLFYHVARNRGVHAAARSIHTDPSSMSRQIVELEDDLGCKLFQRQPFALTSQGQALNEFATPFFANLNDMASSLRGEGLYHLRLATSSTILRDHIHDLLQKLRLKCPELKLTLHEVNQPQAESLIHNEEIDLAISMLDEKLPAGMKSCKLLQAPMALLVNEKVKCASAKEVLEKTDDYCLISLPRHTTFSQLFYREMDRRRKRWRARIEVDSLDLVRSYVMHGFGIGLCVAGTRTALFPALRELPLPGFPPVKIAAFWKRKLPALAAHFLDLVKTRANELAAEFRTSGYLKI